ncbi:hypothetical protein [Halopelagius longus]|uniref:Uncharacterized protein n=1 Tax=Halopelagius longus TaxID=1236180 RepID=A0A1H0YKN5_9EURY|nr:hypothetical protein [Halopelagius longus]RDI72539.1 hypothetical protein DWB78_12885 [Halopelagius longus]SDQ15723.1 hypothetical protein SAMN05216278_0694 [Halopelagius longus]
MVFDEENDAGSGGGEPSDTMRERGSGNRVKLWLLLDANRWVVAVVPLVFLFASLVVLGAVDPVPLRTAIAASDPIETVFQALLTATITGVTLVIAINSLVLSQELGPLGDQRQRMSGAMEFRRDVEEDLNVTAAPPEPSAFLRALVLAVSNRAETLGEVVSTNDFRRDGEYRARLDDYVEAVRGNASEVADELEGSQFGTFDVLLAALDFNYSWKIYQARRLRNEPDELSDDVSAAFDELVNVLTYFGPAREHFKTLYFQWELINLSRAMMYSAVPSLLVSTAAILYLDDPGTVTGTVFGVDNVLWITAAAVAVAVFPFTILISFVLRIATAAKRTLSIGPFILRSGSRSEDLD